jgi:hypothetical protein
MDELVRRLTATMEHKGPASKEAIAKTERSLGVQLPLDYVGFLTFSNGAEGFVGNSYLQLYPIDELATINQEYAVSEFAPGLLIFGSDGGGTAYAYNMNSSPWTIIETPLIGLGLEEVSLCGKTLAEFLNYLYSHG